MSRCGAMGPVGAVCAGIEEGHADDLLSRQVGKKLEDVMPTLRPCRVRTPARPSKQSPTHPLPLMRAQHGPSVGRSQFWRQQWTSSLKNCLNR